MSGGRLWQRVALLLIDLVGLGIATPVSAQQTSHLQCPDGFSGAADIPLTDISDTVIIDCDLLGHTGDYIRILITNVSDGGSRDTAVPLKGIDADRPNDPNAFVTFSGQNRVEQDGQLQLGGSITNSLQRLPPQFRISNNPIDVEAADPSNGEDKEYRIFIDLSEKPDFSTLDGDSKNFSLRIDDNAPGIPVFSNVTGAVGGNGFVRLRWAYDDHTGDKDLNRGTILYREFADQASIPADAGNFDANTAGVTSLMLLLGDALAGNGDTVKVPNLTNGRYYFFRVQVSDIGWERDNAGQAVVKTSALSEPMADPIVPEPGNNLKQYFGDVGCQTALPTADFCGGIAFAMAVWIVKRRRAATALMLLLIFWSLPGFAESGRHGSVSFRGSAYRPDELNDTTHSVSGEGVYDAIYGGKRRFWIELQAGRNLYHGIGTTSVMGTIGYWGARGEAVSETSGTPTADGTHFVMVPLNAAINYRLHLWDRQFLVPYAELGADAWLFRESGPDGTLKGMQKGYHTALGLLVLLDLFDPEAATNLDVDWGVNQTYLSIEYRIAQMTNFSKDPFDLSDRMIVIGIGVDY